MNLKAHYARHEKRIKLMNAAIKGKEILDMGSTEPQGFLHDFFVKNNPDKKFYTLDIRGNPDFKMDLNNPKNLGKKFDTIIAGEIIEHLDNLKRFIDFCYRHLKEGGRLILTTPNAIGLQYILNESWCTFENDDFENHISCFTMPMLDYLLKRRGFKIVKKEYINAFWRVNPIRVISYFIKKLRTDLMIVGEK